MPANCRTPLRLLICAVLACGTVQVAATGVSAAGPSDTQGYVKYYTVAASYQGAPENLTEIAVRFLGSGERSADVYNLNAGRAQANGAGLSDPARLTSGWVLVLPWDAAGDGIKVGQLPTGPKATTTNPGGSSAVSPPGKSTALTPSTPSKAGKPGKPGKAAEVGGKPTCPNLASSGKDSDWSQLRMAPARAWDHSRGNGVMVAVVDSGVDSSLPQLSGRVAAGADVTVAGGRGDDDCIGTGTAMAAIIAATPTSGTPGGMAPAATILPVRLLHGGNHTTAADAATGIEYAVSTGASVIALGSLVDLNEPAVSAALTKALGHDVLVVAGGSGKQGAPATSNTDTGPGSLVTVGGVGPDSQLAAKYAPSGVDVVAPGIDVTSLGVNGSSKVTASGTQYAVAFVAGQAALVRGAYPSLTAAQVKHRIEATADHAGNAAPDQTFGWGMINPASAVTSPLTGENHDAPKLAAVRSTGVDRTVALTVFVLVLLAAMALLLLRARRWARANDDSGSADQAVPSA